ncbi:hypothetical protein AB0A60_35330, partial [Streptomyces sp. NPDC046275]|uniref:hypothetical protein n=1 Tax=Streptomyces sp. NPDC046275 TaxID=3157201 RepID=UPI00340E3F53
MQKVRRRHKLPLHLTDVEVITRQQDYLRREFPQWFDADGRPLSRRLLLFPTRACHARKSSVSAPSSSPGSPGIEPTTIRILRSMFRLRARRGSILTCCASSLDVVSFGGLSSLRCVVMVVRLVPDELWELFRR